MIYIFFKKLYNRRNKKNKLIIIYTIANTCKKADDSHKIISFLTYLQCTANTLYRNAHSEKIFKYHMFRTHDKNQQTYPQGH